MFWALSHFPFTSSTLNYFVRHNISFTGFKRRMSITGKSGLYAGCFRNHGFYFRWFRQIYEPHFCKERTLSFISSWSHTDFMLTSVFPLLLYIWNSVFQTKNHTDIILPVEIWVVGAVNRDIWRRSLRYISARNKLLRGSHVSRDTEQSFFCNVIVFCDAVWFGGWLSKFRWIILYQSSPFCPEIVRFLHRNVAINIHGITTRRIVFLLCTATRPWNSIEFSDPWPQIWYFGPASSLPALPSYSWMRSVIWPTVLTISQSYQYLTHLCRSQSAVRTSTSVLAVGVGCDLEFSYG